jgi:beta-N-acetylhexosaminidase
MSPELESLAAACIFPGFEGVTPPDWVRLWLGRGLGGVVLFGRNVAGGPEQVRALTGELRRERDDVLVGIDEEGGDVTRLEAATGSSYPGNHALGVLDDVEVTERVAASIAADLAAVGIDLNLAPVVDVNSDPLNPVIGIRSFGSDPELVARHGRAFVAGTQHMGVAACAKHFPGHGDTSVDSHKGLPAVTASLETLHARELVPFRAAIDADVRTIMTAHVLVPALGEGPATLSREVLSGLLREELGFEGMAMTDALEMGAISATIPMGEAGVRALAAGADALCLGAEIEDAHVEETCSAIVGAVRSGRLAEERLREAAGRVAATAAWTSRAGGAADRTIGAGAAVRVLEADGEIGLANAPLVVELTPEPNVAAGEASFGLGDALRVRRPETEVMRVHGTPGELPLDGRSLVIVTRDAHRHAWEREAVESLLASARDAVVVETGIPHWRPAGATGYVATHGAARVNLEAAAELICGKPGSDPLSRRS